MPHPNLTSDEVQRLRQAVEQFESAPVAVADTVTMAGTKDAFCTSWPTLKSVLAFLQNLPVIPSGIREAIGKVITWGDMAHGALCRGS